MAGLILNIDSKEDYVVSMWRRWPTPDLELFDGEMRLINSPMATPEERGKKKLFSLEIAVVRGGLKFPAVLRRQPSDSRGREHAACLYFVCLNRWTFDTRRVERQRIKSRGAALRSTASASLAPLKHASCWIVNNTAVKLLISLDITTNVYKLSVGQLRPLCPAGQLSGWVLLTILPSGNT